MMTFSTKGWHVFEPETAVSNWVSAARDEALSALNAPAFARWYQCEGTWFVGLEALDNDERGRVNGGMPLTGSAVDFIARSCGGWHELHKGQISGIFPGYPQRREGETDAGFRYRLKRDAAHIDGVLGLGQPKRRFVKEPHAFILGLPLTWADPGAAPLVVWEGSHNIMRDAFKLAFSSIHPQKLSTLDVTEVYQTARKKVFDTCPRVIVHGPPGSALLVHRLALHGVAPWSKGARADPAGRLIAYFRPPMPGGVSAWVTLP